MMKKILAAVLAAAMVLGLAACGGSGSQEQEAAPETEAAATETEAADETAGLPNPWSDVDTAEAAADGAGVGYFILPEANTEYEGGPVGWYGFRYMERLAEADGAIGAADMTVRKGINEDAEDVSGDYTEYAHEWTVQSADFEVHCFGNEEGQTMKAIWVSDNFAYSIVIRGQGDVYDTYGLSDENIIALVDAIQ